MKRAIMGKKVAMLKIVQARAAVVTVAVTTVMLKKITLIINLAL
jgi:hypothetical protein